MHAAPLFSVVISFLCILAAAPVLSATSLEEQYLSTRDAFIRHFAQTEDSLNDRSALETLEKQLRTAVGPVKFQGVHGQGKINLVTLKEGMVFGQVDGLRFDSEQESLLVTTRGLLARYQAAHPELPKRLDQLARTDDFYRLALHADAGVSSYAVVPVIKGTTQTVAHAFLGLASQETGPFV